MYIVYAPQSKAIISFSVYKIRAELLENFEF